LEPGPALGALCALGSAFTWTIISLLVKTVSETFNSVTINALRSMLGGVLLLSWVLLQDGGAALGQVSPGAFGFLAVSIVLAFAIGDTLFFESTRHLGLARALTVAMTYPLMTALLAVGFLGERITGRLAAGIGLTMGGLALIVTARDPAAPEGTIEPWKGLGAAGLAALAWAVSVILMKPPLKEVDALTAQAIRLPLAGVLLFLLPWARGAVGRFREGDRGTQLRVLSLGGLTALSSVMFVAGLKYADVAVATVLSSTSPMFAIPLGLVFLGERLAVRTLLGAGLTVAGIAVLQPF
jgi:drug/metabolite transporter (DMT)-like permease